MGFKVRWTLLVEKKYYENPKPFGYSQIEWMVDMTNVEQRNYF